MRLFLFFFPLDAPLPTHLTSHRTINGWLRQLRRVSVSVPPASTAGSVKPQTIRSLFPAFNSMMEKSDGHRRSSAGRRYEVDLFVQIARHPVMVNSDGLSSWRCKIWCQETLRSHHVGSSTGSNPLVSASSGPLLLDFYFYFPVHSGFPVLDCQPTWNISFPSVIASIQMF